MRLLFRTLFAAALMAVLWTAAAPRWVNAEQALLPEQSTAKAKQVLQQVITALGGPAYLNVKNYQCDGQIAQFGSNGDLMAFTPFTDEWLLPDKNRTEYIAKGQNTIAAFMIGVDDLSLTHRGSVITVFNGNQGWMLDKAGVTNQPDDTIKTFTEQVKTGMNSMLRSRMNQPDVQVQYGGPDVIEMKEAEWIEFSDAEHHNLRLAVDKYTHLPMRWVVATRDPETRLRTEDIATFAQYQIQDGVKTAMNIVRLHNDRKISQVFLNSCTYNGSISPDLFTRAWLEQHAPQFSKKGYKNAASQ